jgi:hypothetical protein
LPDALGDIVDIGERFGGFPAVDHDCPLPISISTAGGAARRDVVGDD